MSVSYATYGCRIERKRETHTQSLYGKRKIVNAKHLIQRWSHESVVIFAANEHEHTIFIIIHLRTHNTVQSTELCTHRIQRIDTYIHNVLSMVYMRLAWREKWISVLNSHKFCLLCRTNTNEKSRYWIQHQLTWVNERKTLWIECECRNENKLINKNNQRNQWPSICCCTTHTHTHDIRIWLWFAYKCKFIFWLDSFVREQTSFIHSCAVITYIYMIWCSVDCRIVSRNCPHSREFTTFSNFQFRPK